MPKPVVDETGALMTFSMWGRIALAHIIAKWPNQPFPNESIIAWYDDLKGFDPNTVEFALRRLGRHNEWRPTLAQVVRVVEFDRELNESNARAEKHRALQPPEQPSASQADAAAWLRVMRAIARCSSDHPLRVEHARQRAAGEADVAALESILAQHPPGWTPRGPLFEKGVPA